MKRGIKVMLIMYIVMMMNSCVHNKCVHNNKPGVKEPEVPIRTENDCDEAQNHTGGQSVDPILFPNDVLGISKPQESCSQ